MKKIFEFLLILIIFYGVYTVLEKLIPLLRKDIQEVWIIFGSFFFSIFMILMYRLIVKREVSSKFKSSIKNLQNDLIQKDELLSQKDDEIKKAQTFKENLVKEAESTNPVEE